MERYAGGDQQATPRSLATPATKGSRALVTILAKDLAVADRSRSLTILVVGFPSARHLSTTILPDEPLRTSARVRMRCAGAFTPATRPRKRLPNDAVGKWLSHPYPCSLRYLPSRHVRPNQSHGADMTERNRQQPAPPATPTRGGRESDRRDPNARPTLQQKGTPSATAGNPGPQRAGAKPW